MIGSVCALLLSRYLYKDFVLDQINKSGWIHRHWKAIDELVIEQGILVTALLRVTFSPYGISSYVMGVTSINPVHYAIGGSSYIINVLMQVLIGCSLYNVSNDKSQTKHL